MVGCWPKNVVKRTPMVGGKGGQPHAVLPKDAVPASVWEKKTTLLIGGGEPVGWNHGYHILQADLPKMQKAEEVTPTAVTPLISPRGDDGQTVKPIDMSVQFLEQAREDRIAARLPVKAEAGKCPSGYRQTPVTLATGAWCHPCAEDEKLVELQSGEYRCLSNEALVSAAPCAEGTMPVKLRGPGDGTGIAAVVACAQPELLVRKSTVPGVDADERSEAKKKLPVWAWGLILGGGGVVVGGALVGIGVALSRR
jgi:hypothetical protein